MKNQKIKTEVVFKLNEMQSVRRFKTHPTVVDGKVTFFFFNFI